MKRIITIFLVLCASTFCFLLSKSSADERLAVSAERAIVLFIQGDVKVKSIKLNQWIDADLGMDLTRGDSLKTGKDSWAEIGFGTNFANVVRLKENSMLELIDLGPIRLGLLKGDIRSMVEKLEEGSTFEIKTPNAICGARGTGWDSSTDGVKIAVDVFEDKIFFSRLSKDGGVLEETVIKAGKRGLLTDFAKPIFIERIPAAKIKDWKTWKRDFRGRRNVIRKVMRKAKKRPEDIIQPEIKEANRLIDAKIGSKIRRPPTPPRIQEKKDIIGKRTFVDRIRSIADRLDRVEETRKNEDKRSESANGRKDKRHIKKRIRPPLPPPPLNR